MKFTRTTTSVALRANGSRGKSSQTSASSLSSSSSSSSPSISTTTLVKRRWRGRGSACENNPSNNLSSSNSSWSKNVASHPPRHSTRNSRIRRYLMLVSSSTVLYLAFSTFLASNVPAVNGGARTRRSSILTGAVSIFRFSPWTAGKSRTISSNSKIRHNQQQERQHQPQTQQALNVDISKGTKRKRSLRLFRQGFNGNKRSRRILYHPYNRKRRQIASNCFVFIRLATMVSAEERDNDALKNNYNKMDNMNWTCLRGGATSTTPATAGIDNTSLSSLKPVIIVDPSFFQNYLIENIDVAAQIANPTSEQDENKIIVNTPPQHPFDILAKLSVIIQQTAQQKQEHQQPEFTILSGFVCNTALLSFLPPPATVPALSSSFDNDDDESDATTTTQDEKVNDPVDEVPSKTTVSTSSINSKYRFSLYQKGDGSEVDIDMIPTRYMKMQLNNREKAKNAVQETLKWRIENDVDTIIGRPHPDFDVCKTVFPHSFVGRDKHGNVAFIQRPALLNIDLAKKNGLTNHALLNHYVYVNEYMWQIIEADRPLATMTSIIDLKGLNLSVLRQGDIVSFLKVFVQTMDSHFPQRANITLLVNAPKWFNMLYKLISPLLRESTKEKIFIYTNGPKQDEALRQVLDDGSLESLPATFWSATTATTTSTRNDVGSGNRSGPIQVVSELEQELRAFTLARLAEAGLEMQTVVPL